ncbi:MAG: alpha/beta fold hydrolase [Actinomycetota bacterium]
MVTYLQPGALVTDLTFTVPLDHAQPGGATIDLFAREVVAAGRRGADLPWLVYLQGGPGIYAPRPSGESWLGRALKDYRVLLLDQRGTGRSTPANRKTLAGLSAQEQASYLAHFRADSIVADAELIRPQLTGGQPWSVLGQSFGGFCTVTYLSFAPHGLHEAFLCGGLPGLDTHADDVYRATYPIVAERNYAHYRRYPGDVEQVRRIAAHLAGTHVTLPSGARLTVEAFQAVGQLLGSGFGSHELHYLLENPFAGDELTDEFLYRVQAQLTFAAVPLYAVLHEACYAQGRATGWAAQRIRAEFSEFDAVAALDSGQPVLFTGEMIYPWMFEHDPVLQPLRDAAELLAQRDGWPRLYDAAQLAANEVPAAAAVYYDDLYVPLAYSARTAAAIKGLRPWITNEYEHDGLRVSESRVLDRLIALARGNA